MTGAWRPSLLALCGVVSACGDGGRSREYPALVPPAVPTTAPPGTEAVLAPKTLSSLPLGLSAEALCASLGQERSESNQVASDRLALLLSAARVEATLGELVPTNEAASFAAALHVDHVWFGPWFLEGVDTSIVIPAAERERFEPGRYLLGMSQPFPPRNSSDGLGVWREVKAWIPIARSGDYEDLLGYAVPSSARAAVVEIVAVDQESHTAYLHVLEPLAGEVPEDFSADWDAKNRALKFPFAGPAPYVMTFSGFEVPRGRFSDFRPWDETAQAIVRQGLEAPLPVADAGELAAWAESYRTAWAFHVAPHVVETRVSGRGFDLGETVYLSHELRTDFKSNVAVSQLLFEGDGRQLENHSAGPQCGDSFLTALGDEAPLTSAPPELDGACSSLIALPDSESDVTPADFNIHVQLPDSELGREQVAAWIAAPDPVYLLSDAPGPREPAALAADAFWSQTPSLEQTLTIAQLVPITVQSVTRQGSLTHVTLQLSDGGAAPAPLRHLTASCIDPRLLREGSSWLAPVVSDPSGCCADEHSPSFIVPGWLFPASSAR